MKYLFDTEYESTRLNQLSKQCLSGVKITGEVYFGAINGESRLDFSSCFFNDAEQEIINNSGYKYFLLNLLDSLIIYRSDHEQEFSRAGVVKIKESYASIEWIKDGEAETLADIKKSILSQ